MFIFQWPVLCADDIINLTWYSLQNRIYLQYFFIYLQYFLAAPLPLHFGQIMETKMKRNPIWCFQPCPYCWTIDMAYGSWRAWFELGGRPCLPLSLLRMIHRSPLRAVAHLPGRAVGHAFRLFSWEIAASRSYRFWGGIWGTKWWGENERKRGGGREKTAWNQQMERGAT